MQYLIPLLVLCTVVALGGAVLLILRTRRSVAARLLDVDGSMALSPDERSHRITESIGRFGNAFSIGRGSKSLKADLARAGYYSESAAATYIGIKFAMLLVGLLVMTAVTISTGLTTGVKIYLVLAFAAFMFFVPNLYIRHRLGRRQGEVRRHLPDVIDLLEVCVSSGMGLDMAWNSVGDEIRRVSPILADEMALTNLEMQLGATRTDALRHMAERTGAHEVSSLVALLVQSDRFGTSISEALGTFAGSMRESRSQYAEERAEKMAVKLLFPLVFFIFPVMLIVMTGPTAITLYEIMGK